MIPLSEPHFYGNEWKYLKDCLDSGWISAAGPLSTQLEKEFRNICHSPEAVVVSSGTAALHLSLITCGVTPGDLVLVSDYSFIASANVIRYCGADPVFMETSLHTWQADAGAVSEWLKKETISDSGSCVHIASGKKIPAMILVHALGNMADAIRFQQICDTHKISLIEDAAGALGAKIQEKSAGTTGRMGTFSLNGNKIITAGGGGVVLCKNKADADYIRHISRQAKSSTTSYVHDAIGYNYRMPDIMAALALAQLEQLPGFLKRKKEIHTLYRQELPQYIWPEILPGSEPNYWMNACRVKNKTKTLRMLNDAGILAGEFWKPLHTQAIFNSALSAGNLSHTTQIHTECISLPGSVSLKPEDQASIIHLLNKAE